MHIKKKKNNPNTLIPPCHTKSQFKMKFRLKWASLVAQTVNNLPAMQETEWVRSLGEGNGYPLQYSCLENSMGRGVWQAIVHGVTKSQT